MPKRSEGFLFVKRINIYGHLKWSCGAREQERIRWKCQTEFRKRKSIEKERNCNHSYETSAWEGYCFRWCQTEYQTIPATSFHWNYVPSFLPYHSYIRLKIVVDQNEREKWLKKSFSHALACAWVRLYTTRDLVCVLFKTLVWHMIISFRFLDSEIAAFQHRV